MSDYSLSLENVTKIFGRRLIFKNINYTFNSGNAYGIAGSNGSGKSTLARIILGIISTSKGKVLHTYNSKNVEEENLHNHIGFVAPYLNLYDEFTAEENLIHFSNIRGMEYDKERAEELLNRFNILERKDDYLKAYSSGMKQRMKFIFSLLHKPQLLLFDEPTSNLDNKGKEEVYKTIEELSKDSLVLIASNEESDLRLCKDVLEVENYKKGLK